LEREKKKEIISVGTRVQCLQKTDWHGFPKVRREVEPVSEGKISRRKKIQGAAGEEENEALAQTKSSEKKVSATSTIANG